MSIRITDRWRSPSRGTAAQIKAALHAAGVVASKDVDDCVDEVYRLCGLVTLDAVLLLAHVCVETGGGNDGIRPFSSPAWASVEAYRDTRNRYNPAGIGITDGPDLGFGFAGGKEAAQALVVHHAVYEIPANDKAWDVLKPYLSLDPRYSAVPAANRGTVKTVNDLGGKWWTEAQGAANLASRGNTFFTGIPDQTSTTSTGGSSVATITYGNVPKPAIVDRVIPDADNWAWNNLGQLDVLGVVYHRQEGTNWGTDGWFRQLWQPNGQPAGGQLGLTSFGLPADGVSSPLMMWNPFDGKARAGVSANRSPWASGPWQSPQGGDGHAFVAKYGVNAINQKLVAIEIDEFYTDPIADAGIDLIVELSAWLADQKKVPYTDYPINPATGLVFTYTHNEFQDEKPCAGVEVIDDVATIIAKTRDRLEHYQTATSKPPVVTPPKPLYVKPVVPAFLKLWPWVQEQPFNDVVMTLATDLYKDPNGGIKVLAGGMASAKETRAPFAKDETFPIVYEWEKAGIHWGLDPVGNRIDLTKAVRVSEWKPQQIAAPAKTT